MPDQILPSIDSKDETRRGLFAALTIDIAPLRASRDYRLLYAGQFVSGFGSAISYVVLPWQMYQLTHSSLAVGMIGVVEFAPMFLMAFIGGALADYIDRPIRRQFLQMKPSCAIKATRGLIFHATKLLFS